MLILHSCAGVALLVYIPATVYLSLKNSSSTFDQAGGEVAYAVIQICCWLGESGDEPADPRMRHLRHHRQRLQ